MEIAFKFDKKEVMILNSSPVGIAFEVLSILGTFYGRKFQKECREKDFYTILQFLVSARICERFESVFEGRFETTNFSIEILKAAPHIKE